MTLFRPRVHLGYTAAGRAVICLTFVRRKSIVQKHTFGTVAEKPYRIIHLHFKVIRLWCLFSRFLHRLVITSTFLLPKFYITLFHQADGVVQKPVLKAHANGRNIVGPNMLRPFAWNRNNVGTCCV